MSESVFLNPQARDWVFTPSDNDTTPLVLAFHKTLPGYNQTRLHALPDVAQELGLGHVFLKDESDRFGLPSFKILGASWAVYRAVCAHLGVDATTSLAELGRRAAGLRLATATAGNWGRAVARMAGYLGLEVTVFVTDLMVEYTREKIRSEGAEVRPVPGDYDDSLEAARRFADETGALLVVDTSWEGFETIPLVGFPVPGSSRVNIVQGDRLIGSS